MATCDRCGGSFDARFGDRFRKAADGRIESICRRCMEWENATTPGPSYENLQDIAQDLYHDLVETLEGYSDMTGQRAAMLAHAAAQAFRNAADGLVLQSPQNALSERARRLES